MRSLTTALQSLLFLFIAVSFISNASASRYHCYPRHHVRHHVTYCSSCPVKKHCYRHKRYCRYKVVNYYVCNPCCTVEYSYRHGRNCALVKKCFVNRYRCVDRCCDDYDYGYGYGYDSDCDDCSYRSGVYY